MMWHQNGVKVFEIMIYGDDNFFVKHPSEIPFCGRFNPHNNLERLNKVVCLQNCP